jgi:hypothetical protein
MMRSITSRSCCIALLLVGNAVAQQEPASTRTKLHFLTKSDKGMDAEKIKRDLQTSGSASKATYHCGPTTCIRPEMVTSIPA